MKLLPVLVATQAASPMSINSKVYPSMKADAKLKGNITDAGFTDAYCTPDGDSRLYKGVAKSTQEAIPSNQMKRLADLSHLSQTKVKRAKKRTFSLDLFPGMTKKKDREECQCVLAAHPRGLTFTWWGCYGLCLT